MAIGLLLAQEHHTAGVGGLVAAGAAMIPMEALFGTCLQLNGHLGGILLAGLLLAGVSQVSIHHRIHHPIHTCIKGSACTALQGSWLPVDRQVPISVVRCGCW